MKNKMRKLLAYLMTLILVLQMAPINALAAGEVMTVTVTGLEGISITDDYYIVVGIYSEGSAFQVQRLNSASTPDNGVTRIAAFTPLSDPYVILKKSTTPDQNQPEKDIIVRNPGGSINVNQTFAGHTVSMTESSGNYTINVEEEQDGCTV